MKKILCLLLILLSIPLVFAQIDDPYKEYVKIRASNTTKEIVSLENGLSLYVQSPNAIYQNTNFQIKTILLLHEDSLGTINISRGDIQLKPQFYAGDANEETPFLLTTWNDNIPLDAEYKITITKKDASLETYHFKVLAKQNPIVDEKIETNYIPTEFNPTTQQLNLLKEYFNQKDYFYSDKEIQNMMRDARGVASIDKTSKIIYQKFENGVVKNITKVTLNLNKLQNFKELSIIEFIPKEFASSTNDLSYSDTPTIIQEDPVIMWDLKNAKELSYTVDSKTSATGNTIMLLTQKDDSNMFKIILPALLIPLIAVIIIYFAKFSPKNKGL